MHKQTNTNTHTSAHTHTKTHNQFDPLGVLTNVKLIYLSNTFDISLLFAAKARLPFLLWLNFEYILVCSFFAFQFHFHFPTLFCFFLAFLCLLLFRVVICCSTVYLFILRSLHVLLYFRYQDSISYLILCFETCLQLITRKWSHSLLVRFAKMCKKRGNDK